MINGNISEFIKFDKTGKAVLYKEERFHVVLLNLPEGEELKPHISKTDVFCIVQKGEAEFILEGKSIIIKKGDLISFKAKEEHAVKARTDFSMLLMK